MQRIVTVVQGLIAEDDGQDLLEYALLAVLIAVVAAGAVATLGNQLKSVFWEAIANNF